MNSSLKLFSVRGIDIRVHLTFPLILLWAAFQFGVLGGGGLAGALFGVTVISLLFVLVTLHELGHSFAALHYGVPVERIVLLPIGGVAQLSHMPDKPKQELVIALAGPAVNVALAIVMGGIALLFGLPLSNPLTSGVSLTFGAIFSYIFFYNVVLAVFNMIPAFPMDGGRVLRSAMAMWLDYGRSTQIAAGIGRTLAVLFGIYGLLNGQFFSVLIAIFIYSGATQEARMVQFRQKLRGYTVQQAYNSQVPILQPADSLREVVNWTARGLTDFPVAHFGSYVGFLGNEQLMSALQQNGPDQTVASVMSKDVEPVSLTTDLYDVQQRLSNEKLSALPVVEYGRIVGIISSRHIRHMLRMATMRPELFPRVQSA
ncbi:site-2 protease family protein [Candidatus Leptofilum sp.]|uniref:site-2 protease family protein n=1 Tax=Candidatus Leptofilum sp. TaxID=3241576 RepID=UPI003B5C4B1A